MPLILFAFILARMLLCLCIKAQRMFLRYRGVLCCLVGFAGLTLDYSWVLFFMVGGCQAAPLPLRAVVFL
jgi:hypothetical protein